VKYEEKAIGSTGDSCLIMGYWHNDREVLLRFCTCSNLVFYICFPSLFHQETTFLFFAYFHYILGYYPLELSDHATTGSYQLYH
jgi:hypothetical protein